MKKVTSPTITPTRQRAKAKYLLGFAIIFNVFGLTGCASYFSEYRTVYRIETTEGTRYYSASEPDLNEANNVYSLKDLDGNAHQIEKGRIHTIQKFRHKR